MGGEKKGVWNWFKFSKRDFIPRIPLKTLKPVVSEASSPKQF